MQVFQQDEPPFDQQGEPNQFYKAIDQVYHQYDDENGQ